jgi:hypothetical protein
LDGGAGVALIGEVLEPGLQEPVGNVFGHGADHAGGARGRGQGLLTVR